MLQVTATAEDASHAVEEATALQKKAACRKLSRIYVRLGLRSAGCAGAVQVWRRRAYDSPKICEIFDTDRFIEAPAGPLECTVTLIPLWSTGPQGDYG